MDLLELVEERTLHDPQPWPSLEKLYGKYGCYVYCTETQWNFTPPRCMQNLHADLVAIVERMLDMPERRLSRWPRSESAVAAEQEATLLAT